MSRLSFRRLLHHSLPALHYVRIVVGRLCGVPRFRCDVSKLLQLFFVTTPRKRGKMQGVRWLVLVKSQISGHCICLILIGLYYGIISRFWLIAKEFKSYRLALTDEQIIRSVNATDRIIRLVWMHLYICLLVCCRYSMLDERSCHLDLKSVKEKLETWCLMLTSVGLMGR